MAERPPDTGEVREGPTGAGAPVRHAQRSMEDDEISLLELGNVFLRRRGTILRTVLVVTLAALAFILLTPRTFTAVTSFVPQSPGGGGSGLRGLAGQFGFALPSENPGESPQFYAELVKSREILGALAREEFRFLVPGEEAQEPEVQSGTLPDLLELESRAENPELRREAAIRWLGGAVSVSTGRETGTVKVSVSTPWAGLSKVLADRILEMVTEFNLQTRQSKAAAERRFVEGRLTEAMDSLRAAEDRLESFLENNRQFLAARSSSPELSFQHERLQREVVMRQQVYTGLAQAHEEARIAEVRNTPIITLVESPELPVRPDSRGGSLKLALGIMLGGMLGVFLAFMREFADRSRREEGEEYREFSSLWAQTWNEVVTLGGLLGRRSGRAS